MQLPDIPGILDADEVVATVDAIAEIQLADGMIPWFPGGHCDPWNHVEAAMALSVGGRVWPPGSCPIRVGPGGDASWRG